MCVCIYLRVKENGNFLDNLALAQSLPGPVVINLSLLAGYRLRGIKGSISSVLGTGDRGSYIHLWSNLPLASTGYSGG